MSNEEYTISAVSHPQQTVVGETADRADDSPHETDRFVVCLFEYWKELCSFLMEYILPDKNKESKLPQSTFVRMMEQAKHISQDYIYRKLSEKEMSKRLSFGGYNSALSEQYIIAGQVLEKMYPKVYCDVSRRIGRTMSTPGIVKATLNDVLNILFRDSITWGKIVSMFAIASSFAEECVQQGHPGYVSDVIDTVGGFTAMHLVEWLVKRGGWKGLEQSFKDGKDTINPSWLIGLVGAVVGFVTVTMSFVIELT